MTLRIVWAGIDFAGMSDLLKVERSEVIRRRGGFFLDTHRDPADLKKTGSNALDAVPAIACKDALKGYAETWPPRACGGL